jgi:MoaA/NifB/PqqE/SkfB family radical SAM enzyme
MTASIRRLGYLLQYYVRSRLGDKRPLLGGVKLTHRCNLSCIHCPFRKRETASLSFPQVLASLRTLHQWGVRIVILEGGEPFLWRDDHHDIKSVVAEARKLFFSVGVTTNGTLPIDVDSDIVWVSIDGLQPTHDRIRGKSFETVMANIESSSHPRIYAHITINSLNWAEISDLVHLLAPKVKGITVQFHYPFQEVGRELLLTPANREGVLDMLMGLKREGLPIANSYASLEALKGNHWQCRPWMIASVDPDGRLTHGCYLKGRGQISCSSCGFSAHTEISLAYGGAVESILVGLRTFSLVEARA